MNNYYRWLILTTIYACLLFVAEFYYGLLSKTSMYGENWINFTICSLIGLTFVVGVFSKDKDRLGFISASLGILGTFIGTLILFQSAFSGDIGDSEAIKEVIGELIEGVSVAFNTSIVGLVSSIALSLYSVGETDEV